MFEKDVRSFFHFSRGECNDGHLPDDFKQAQDTSEFFLLESVCVDMFLFVDFQSQSLLLKF